MEPKIAHDFHNTFHSASEPVGGLSSVFSFLYFLPLLVFILRGGVPRDSPVCRCYASPLVSNQRIDRRVILHYLFHVVVVSEVIGSLRICALQEWLFHHVAKGPALG